jgi:hypothetical protein
VGVDAQPGAVVNGRPAATRRAAAIGLVAVALLGPRGAGAQSTKAACIAAHGDGQELRLHGRWRDAEARFRACSTGCPGPITEDCARWYDEVRAKMPTLLVAATGPDGADTVDVALLVDGVHTADRLPATAFEVDPGEHVVRLEHPGWTPVEQRIVVRESEKDKRVALSFAPASAPSAGTSEAAPAASSAPVLGYVLLGVGAVAAAVAIPFFVVGKVDENDLRNDSCGPTATCLPDTVGQINRDYAVAGIAGGVGLVAIGLGVWQLLSHKSARATDAVFGPSGVTVSF